MATETSIISSQTDIKQNFANGDNEVDAQDQILREKVRIWDKITRIEKDGIEQAVIIPFDTYIEPFYSEADMDATYTTGKYDSDNECYRLYSDANGNYKQLQSKCICWQNNRTLASINMTVYAEDTLGNESTNYESFIYNGYEWIAIKNGFKLYLLDYIGSDLDADLDAYLGGQISNKDTDGNIIFQNKLKWKINRIGSEEVIIKKVIIKVTWNEAWTSYIYGLERFPTPFGTWGYI